MTLDAEVVFRILWLIVFCVVLWGMLTHHAFIPSWIHQNDKIMHFVAFGVLAGVAHGAWPSMALTTLWLLLCGLGVLAEGAQHFTVRHRFCWRDAVANALGAGCVLLLLHWAL